MLLDLEGVLALRNVGATGMTPPSPPYTDPASPSSSIASKSLDELGEGDVGSGGSVALGGAEACNEREGSIVSMCGAAEVAGGWSKGDGSPFGNKGEFRDRSAGDACWDELPFGSLNADGLSRPGDSRTSRLCRLGVSQ